MYQVQIFFHQRGELVIVVPVDFYQHTGMFRSSQILCFHQFSGDESTCCDKVFVNFMNAVRNGIQIRIEGPCFFFFATQPAGLRQPFLRFAPTAGGDFSVGTINGDSQVNSGRALPSLIAIFRKKIWLNNFCISDTLNGYESKPVTCCRQDIHSLSILSVNSLGKIQCVIFFTLLLTHRITHRNDDDGCAFWCVPKIKNLTKHSLCEVLVCFVSLVCGSCRI